MYMKRFYITLILAILSATFTIKTAEAVTKQEMNQARAIAGLWYLRYMNNGSDYLEKLNPKDIDELEGSLKVKEKENISTFKKVSIPNDYESWDKEKLVEYWSKTAFEIGKFPQESYGAKSKIRGKINEMSVTAPNKKNEQNEKVEEHKETENKSLNENNESDPLSLAQDEQEKTGKDSTFIENTNHIETDVNAQSGDGSTIVYIVILIVLVLIVMGIIIYAVNSMKKNRDGAGSVPSDEYEDQRRRLVATIAEKDNTISQMNDEIEHLKQELANLRGRQIRTTDSNYRVRPISPQNPRTIYLAQANHKGVFVRADGKYNIGNSIYKLITTDGVSGTYCIIEDTTVFDLALTQPINYLMTACIGENLQLSEGMNKIINETPGTAIFEDGKWRVLRKARIRYDR